MKLSDLFKKQPRFKRPPRTNAPMQPRNPSEPTHCRTPELRLPKSAPKPSQLLRDLRGAMPEPTIHDYENFKQTVLSNAMLQQAQEGETHIIIMCVTCFGVELELLNDFLEWKDWLIEQGITVESSFTPEDYDEYYIVSWGETK